MAVGWLKLWRTLLTKPIWLDSSPEHKSVLIALLMKANWVNRQWTWEGRPFKAETGQFVTSVPKLVEACGRGVSAKNVRTALSRFEGLGFLVNRSSKMSGRLITICNWETYQARQDDESIQNEEQTAVEFPQRNPLESIDPGRPLAVETAIETAVKVAVEFRSVDPPNGDKGAVETAIETAVKVAANKKIKKLKEGYTPSFETFWSAYPLKKEKAGAFKVWQTRVNEDINEQNLILAATNYAEECRRNGTESRYIKHPATFLGPKRAFDDYLTKPNHKDGDTRRKTNPFQDLVDLKEPLSLPTQTSH